jgi:hopanoid biosynthesis associated RND transporter like protein HpnN
MRNPVPKAVVASIARPWLTLAAALVIALVALVYTAGHFAMSTDTAALISPKVAWRQHEIAFDDAFPQLRDSMIVVIDGKTPELAEDAATRLSAALEADKAHFRNVRRPDGGTFFAQEGLLFSSTDDVHDATGALVNAQPLLGPLASDPSLRGVGNAFGTMLDGVNSGGANFDAFSGPMSALADAIDGRLAGKPANFSWQTLFASGAGALKAPTRRLVLVRPVLDFDSLTPGAPAANAVAVSAGKLGLDAHGVSVRLTGDVPLSDQDFASLQENIGLVGAVMFSAMLLTLWFATRSVRLVGAILGTTVVGLVATLAIGLVAVGQLNLISIAFIPLFVGLGVDFGIQLSVRFNAERIDGTTTPLALERAAAALGTPLTLAAAAIVLGLAAFLPTAYVGIAELGVIAAIGMVIALALSVTLLPALIVLLRPPPSAREVGFASAAPLDRLLHRRRRAVLWGFGIALAASVALLPRVVFDFDPMSMRDQNAPAMRTLTDLTRDPDRTPETISVLAKDEATARQLVASIGALREVRQVVWLDSFIPADQPAKLAAVTDASTVLDFSINPFDVSPPPDDAALATAARDLADKLAASAAAHPGPGAPDALRLSSAMRRLAQGTPAQRSAADAMLSMPLKVTLDQIRAILQAHAVDRASLPAELANDWKTADSRYRIEVTPSGDPRNIKAMRAFGNAVSRITPDISGLPVVTEAAAVSIAGAFIEAGVIALVLVSLLLLWALRSARETLFTLAPVVLSIFLTLGTCVVIGQPLNFANIIAFPLLFGVGVAFHIYFVMAWRGGARDLLQSSLARAVLFSALATGTAFGSLWLSDHPGTASMGKILMISLVWTLICALVFEPALLGPPRRVEEPRKV